MRRLLPWLLAPALGCSGGEGPEEGKELEDTSTPREDTADPTDDSGQTDDTGGACSDGEARVEVGTGDEGFEALAAGAPVTMVHGPQGGWHVLGSARIWNMEPIVDIHFLITAVEPGLVVADNLYRVATVPETQCTSLYWGMYGYLDVREMEEGELDTPPELLAHEDLEIRMIITDRSGVRVESAVVVEAVPDPADLEEDDPTGR